MQKCFAIVALLAVGASAQFPTQCVVDVGLGAYGLVNAGLAINSAVTDCGASGTAGACTADVGKVVAGLGKASGYGAVAAESCGGANGTCAADVSFGIASVGTALKFAGDAAGSCAGDNTTACVLDVYEVRTSLIKAVDDFEAAAASCGGKALPASVTACVKTGTHC